MVSYHATLPSATKDQLTQIARSMKKAERKHTDIPWLNRRVRRIDGQNPAVAYYLEKTLTLFRDESAALGYLKIAIVMYTVLDTKERFVHHLSENDAGDFCNAVLLNSAGENDEISGIGRIIEQDNPLISGLIKSLVTLVSEPYQRLFERSLYGLYGIRRLQMEAQATEPKISWS